MPPGDVDRAALCRVNVNRMGRGRGGLARQGSVGLHGRRRHPGKEEGNVLAMDGEGDEAEMMGGGDVRRCRRCRCCSLPFFLPLFHISLFCCAGGRGEACDASTVEYTERPRGAGASPMRLTGRAPAPTRSRSCVNPAGRFCTKVVLTDRNYHTSCVNPLAGRSRTDRP